MYQQPGQEDFLFYMLYAAAAMLSLIAGCYLWFRQGNAFARYIKSPVRLRRWTAALFAAMTLSHVAYLPAAFLTSADDMLLCYIIGGLVDCLTVIPLAVVIMLCMLQDRRRPLWPVWALLAPLAVGVAACVVCGDYYLMNIVRAYFLLLVIGLIIYMVREVRHYGRWLRDNYADLEHKEVWQSFVVQAAILLFLNYYAFGFGWKAYDYVVQVLDIVLVCYLLWRVETLSDLSAPQDQSPEGLSQATYDYVGTLLQQRCVGKQLYLQHGLTVTQLAKAIGTNRYYLSQYFSTQGITYNAYINDLRINHFVSLYREAVAAKRPFTAQRLASECGYRSYSTFTLAFKQRMGQNISAWMQETT